MRDVGNMNTPGRLTVLLATYPWAFETPGGGEVQLKKYAQYLAARGIDVRFYDPWRRNLADASVVHFFSCMGGSTHLCAYVKQCGLPLVVSSSLWITDSTRHLYPVEEIRAQLSLADVIVTNSIIESDQLSRQLGLPRDRFATVLNGVEPQFASVGPEMFREKTGIRGRFILNVAAIEPRKNQLGLVHALKDSPLPLILIGPSRDQHYTEQVFAAAGPHVQHLGSLDHDDPLLASALSACSVFVLPSTLETPGLAALEAAVCGAPLVITSGGSTREYFGECAHYVDPGDPSDMRQAVEVALINGPNPRLREHVLRFAWSTVTARLPDLYRTALERNNSTASRP
jgi:glycosyltransferase involved in cell wall biosynthesis